ncbi:MAG: class I SAM-dependent methyltransferase [Candidatus Thiodiazotropha taylori]|nr:class I SAM-dependent methyltransferase [Candidatus Thiodiazotropha taylori]MCG7910111.1 class I SAM-dependent methyltransferase [Candidatus Thiodiazotropha taylori]MCG7926105.1 class I SAM-dependent methyltransferase [Candidatus Thiodiazotropha taylori]MCG8086022.1 class I SAM-dependent methyltransferase [Candidatus Thiodiazotropha taylori]RLW63137.1 MAG: hypothetical protein B6D73_17260 [gamma proteobacterium symbiont of Stewartia floridana]
MTEQNSSTSKIIEIRPKVVFQAVENRYQAQNTEFTVNIPSSAIGGLTLLESAILVSFVKLISPAAIFEFGTYMGATTLLFARNSSDSTEIITIDIDPNTTATQENISEADYLNDGNANDEHLRDIFAKHGAIYINRAERHLREKVTQLYQDSTTIDPQQQNFLKRFQLIFIDGGHDFETVRSDTENALNMAADDAIIVWHDFRSQIHDDVTRFLDGFSQTHEIVHVAHTMLAFMLIGSTREILN